MAFGSNVLSGSARGLVIATGKRTYFGALAERQFGRLRVFVNAENERLAVLYKRKDGNYGLIEPAVGGDYTPKKSKSR